MGTGLESAEVNKDIFDLYIDGFTDDMKDAISNAVGILSEVCTTLPHDHPVQMKLHNIARQLGDAEFSLDKLSAYRRLSR